VRALKPVKTNTYIKHRLLIISNYILSKNKTKQKPNVKSHEQLACSVPYITKQLASHTTVTDGTMTAEGWTGKDKEGSGSSLRYRGTTTVPAETEEVNDRPSLIRDMKPGPTEYNARLPISYKRQYTTTRDIKKFYILPTDCIYVFFFFLFFANATTCPLWTSWSPLPVVAEV
jgi:hypothetical protein